MLYLKPRRWLPSFTTIFHCQRQLRCRLHARTPIACPSCSAIDVSSEVRTPRFVVGFPNNSASPERNPLRTVSMSFRTSAKFAVSCVTRASLSGSGSFAFSASLLSSSPALMSSPASESKSFVESEIRFENLPERSGWTPPASTSISLPESRGRARGCELRDPRKAAGDRRPVLRWRRQPRRAVPHRR